MQTEVMLYAIDNGITFDEAVTALAAMAVEFFEAVF